MWKKSCFCVAVVIDDTANRCKQLQPSKREGQAIDVHPCTNHMFLAGDPKGHRFESPVWYLSYLGGIKRKLSLKPRSRLCCWSIHTQNSTRKPQHGHLGSSMWDSEVVHKLKSTWPEVNNTKGPGSQWLSNGEASISTLERWLLML